MCGIIGIVGIQPVSDRLIESLKRLEYRGYDSAGIAAQVNGVLERRRAPGKLKELEKVLAANPLVATTGIGHTRWPPTAPRPRPTPTPTSPAASPSSTTASSRISPS